PIRHGRWLVLYVAHYGGCTNDEQAAQVPVSLLGDAAEPGLAAGGMLLRCQPEPGSELPGPSELIGSGAGGRESRGRDHAEAGDSGEPATSLAFGVPGDELPIQHRDLIVERHDLVDKNPQRSTGISWQSVLIRQRLFGQLRQIGDARICDKTEF